MYKNTTVSTQLQRTHYPKHAHYNGDGSGRDHYIISNTGGLTQVNKTQMHVGTSFYREKRPGYNVSHSPGKEATTFQYISDGSGRDSYVIQNSGGLRYDYNHKSNQQVFLSSLRDNSPSRIKEHKPDGKTDITHYLNWQSPNARAMQVRTSHEQKRLTERLSSPKQIQKIQQIYIQKHLRSSRDGKPYFNNPQQTGSITGGVQQYMMQTASVNNSLADQKYSNRSKQNVSSIQKPSIFLNKRASIAAQQKSGENNSQKVISQAQPQYYDQLISKLVQKQGSKAPTNRNAQNKKEESSKAINEYLNVTVDKVQDQKSDGFINNPKSPVGSHYGGQMQVKDKFVTKMRRNFGKSVEPQAKSDRNGGLLVDGKSPAMKQTQSKEDDIVMIESNDPYKVINRTNAINKDVYETENVINKNQQLNDMLTFFTKRAENNLKQNNGNTAFLHKNNAMGKSNGFKNIKKNTDASLDLRDCIRAQLKSSQIRTTSNHDHIKLKKQRDSMNNTAMNDMDHMKSAVMSRNQDQQRYNPTGKLDLIMSKTAQNGFQVAKQQSQSYFSKHSDKLQGEIPFINQQQTQSNRNQVIQKNNSGILKPNAAASLGTKVKTNYLPYEHMMQNAKSSGKLIQNPKGMMRNQENVYQLEDQESFQGASFVRPKTHQAKNRSNNIYRTSIQDL